MEYKEERMDTPKEITKKRNNRRRKETKKGDENGKNKAIMEVKEG